MATNTTSDACKPRGRARGRGRARRQGNPTVGQRDGGKLSTASPDTGVDPEQFCDEKECSLDSSSNLSLLSSGDFNFTGTLPT